MCQALQVVDHGANPEILREAWSGIPQRSADIRDEGKGTKGWLGEGGEDGATPGGGSGTHAASGTAR